MFTGNLAVVCPVFMNFIHALFSAPSVALWLTIEEFENA